MGFINMERDKVKYSRVFSHFKYLIKTFFPLPSKCRQYEYRALSKVSGNIAGLWTSPSLTLKFKTLFVFCFGSALKYRLMFFSSTKKVKREFV